LGYYIKEYPEYQSELIVPIFVSGRYNRDMMTTCKAVIDTGSNCSLIEKEWALDELHLAERMIRDSFYQPQKEKVRTEEAQKWDVKVVDLFASVGDPPTRIEGSIEAILVEEVDNRSRGIKIILGMDFLNNMNISYVVGRQGAIFAILQPL